MAAAVAGSTQMSVAETGGPIQVLSTSHEIEFPTQIVLRLDAESESNITDITLHYNLGRREALIYGYPSFTPAPRVSADFTIKADGADYVPSGVDIRYFYVIKDAAGNELESEPLLLEYKDPSFEWQRLERDYVTYLWHDRPVSSVVSVAGIVEARLEPVTRLLGSAPASHKKAVIVNDGAEAALSFPSVSRTATENHLYGGFAFGELDVFVLVGLDPNGIVHEMTHLLLDEAIDSPFARIPSWLNEGLAMYFESGARGRDTTVSRAADQGRLLPLRSMGNVPGRPEDVRLFYAEAWSIVTHMMNVHGEGRMSALLNAIDDGQPVEEALPAVYGVTLDELQREWQDGIGGRSLSGTTVDPGTLGTSLIIASAVAVAMFVILFRWLQRLGSPVDTGDAEP